MAGDTDGGRTARVVVIDDDEAIHMLTEILLNVDGRFQVAGRARNAVEGIRVAERIDPDVVILDLHMPGPDGLAAIPLLRQRAPGAAIVVLSAFPDPYTLFDVVSQGADAYLDKGRAHAELVPTLISLLEEAGALWKDAALAR